MSEDIVALSLSRADIERLIEGLDSHEYWQLSDPSWRHSGDVRLPSDVPDPLAEPPELTADEVQVVEEIEACRRLQEVLRKAAQSLS